ncbi:MAG: hypothetical protein AB1846_00925 [Chloroflexota bacterium]
MNKKLGWVIGALVVTLLAVGAYGTTTAFADDNTPALSFGGRGPGGPGGHPGGHPLTDAELEAVAAVLDMSTDDLSAALADGKTLDYLAGEAGVDLQEIRDALQAVHAEAMRERIAQAVADGSITQEKADWLLEGLDKGFLDGPGLGFGFGGRHGGGIPPVAPTPTE